MYLWQPAFKEAPSDSFLWVVIVFGAINSYWTQLICDRMYLPWLSHKRHKSVAVSWITCFGKASCYMLGRCSSSDMDSITLQGSGPSANKHSLSSHIPKNLRERSPNPMKSSDSWSPGWHLNYVTQPCGTAKLWSQSWHSVKGWVLIVFSC
jgi:hypothetical protein